MRRVCGGYAVGMRWVCDGYAVGMRWVCCGYAVGMRWVCGGYAVGMRWDAGGGDQVEQGEIGIGSWPGLARCLRDGTGWEGKDGNGSALDLGLAASCWAKDDTESPLGRQSADPIRC
jgi:hypothetical protein